MTRYAGVLLVGILALVLAAPLAAQLGWDDLAGPKVDQPAMGGGQYDDGEFDQILRREQRLFTDQQFHQKPLRSYSRSYPRYYNVTDSWFDVYWDTPAFSTTTKSDGASLISFMFRDICSFPEPMGRNRTFFNIQQFVDTGLRRWGGSRQTYPVYGHWSLQDFSNANRELVSKYLTNVASFSFMQHFHAANRNDSSKAFTFQRIIHFIDYYKLPAVCLIPGTNETVLVYKVVVRDDGLAAMFYYRPSDAAFLRKANEQYMKNVIFVVPQRARDGRLAGIQYFNNAQYENRTFRFYSGHDDVLIIDDMAQVYAEVAPMLRMSAVLANVTGKGDPIAGGMFLGTMLGTLFTPGLSGDEKAGAVSTLLLGTAAGTALPSQQAYIAPPVSQQLQFPQEYPYGYDKNFLPAGGGVPYGQYVDQQQQQYQGQVSDYYPGQFAGDQVFQGGQVDYYPGAQTYPGGQLPPWVIQEQPQVFDLNAFFRYSYQDQNGGCYSDPRVQPRDHSLPPDRMYPGDGYMDQSPGCYQPVPLPYQPPVYLPPVKPLPPYCPEPPVYYPPIKPPVYCPPTPPCPPTWQPPTWQPPTYTPPPPPPCPTWNPPKPTWTPPPPPPTWTPPKPPCPPPTKPCPPPTVMPSDCNAKYPNRSSKGHLFSGWKTGTGAGNFKLIGECYDDEYYNRFGYDEDGYDRQGYDPWGEDRRGYDKKGYDPWGYDRKGEDPKGHKCHDVTLNSFRAQYHSAPLKFRLAYAIGSKTGTIVRRKDRRTMWQPNGSRPVNTGDEDDDKPVVTNQDDWKHTNIDKNRPYTTNQQGHIIQVTPAGGNTHYQGSNQQSQSDQKDVKPTVVVPTTDKDQKGNNAPVSRRVIRTYNRN